MITKKFLCWLLVLITLFVLPLHVSAYDYGDNDIIIDYLPGDVDNNGKLTSADARLCLRALAKLETLTEEQLKAADLDENGEIDSSNARSILRAAAKLETLTVTVNLEAGQQIVVGPYRPLGIYSWTCKTDSTDIIITETYENNLPDEAVGFFDQFFTITTDAKDSFIVTVLAECPWNGEIACSFDLNIIVSD